MIKVICSVFDSKAGVFANPFVAVNLAVARRDYLYACTDPTTALSRNPSDYSLFQLATFDDESGLLTACVPPVFISSSVSSEV